MLDPYFSSSSLMIFLNSGVVIRTMYTTVVELIIEHGEHLYIHPPTTFQEIPLHGIVSTRHYRNTNAGSLAFSCNRLCFWSKVRSAGRNQDPSSL